MQGTLSQAPTYTWDATHGDRGFWTKRKKTAVSLISVMAMIAGLAVAFSLFDRNVNDNVVRDAANFDFTVEKKDALLGDADWIDTASGAKIYSIDPANPEAASQYPGDTRRVEVRVSNTNVPSKDATFQLRIKDVEVLNKFNGIVKASWAPRDEFLSFWDLTIARQQIITDHNGDDVAVNPFIYTTSCNGSLTELADPNAPACNLGTVRGSAYIGGPEETNPQDFSSRNYRFDLTMTDNGQDQSFYQGWSVRFDVVLEAKVPGDPIPAGPGTR